MGSKVTQLSSCLPTVSYEQQQMDICCYGNAAGIVVEKYSGSRTFEDLVEFVDDNRIDD